MTKEAINECVEKIIAKDFTKAKVIIAEHLKNSPNNKIIGSVFALEGIIAKYSPKNVDMNDSIDDFKMMKKSINSKLSSVWIDDFEKGYFSVWKVFTKNAIEKLDKEGIVDNPAEKEQANEASHTSI
ncbi:MAG: hypothetical protein ATL_03170 [Thaumarchaeota archaeon]|jgi:hypothetical protein|nr:hypothetical protein [Nitrososphaerales archaeon]NSL73945.1 hypothetical protein [Nitrososphaerota archaeon]NSL74373.1 hypothetical protein [Nitrososphaerota archaeon]